MYGLRCHGGYMYRETVIPRSKRTWDNGRTNMYARNAIEANSLPPREVLLRRLKDHSPEDGVGCVNLTLL